MMAPYYQDDAVTIYHGDCREIAPTLGRFDLLLTDPPYGIGFAARPTNSQRSNGMIAADWDDFAPDIIPFLATADFAAIWGGNYFPLPPSRGWLVWLKRGNAPSMADAEFAWTSRNMNARAFHKSVRAASLEKSLSCAPHPTQKPIELMRWTIDFFPSAQTILDPFMGSGTTLRAAKDLGRKAIGIEIEEKYCEIAARRMEQEVLAF